MLLTMDKRYNHEFHRGEVIFFKKGLCATETGVAHKYYAYVGDSSPFAVLTASHSNTLPGTTPVTEDMTAKLPEWIEVMVADDSFPAEEQVKVRLNPLYALMLKTKYNRGNLRICLFSFSLAPIIMIYHAAQEVSMILCNKDCMPCCDFCIYAIHEEFEENGKLIKGGPIGCNKHQDEEHQEIAESCGYCPDYHCFNVPLDKEKSNP